MKIAIITGSRADYGLLEPLIGQMMLDPSLQTYLLVTGSHLSPDLGMTVNDISYPIEKIEILLSSDTSVGVSKAMGLALISFAEVYDRIKPDLVVVLGDRFEIMAAVTAAHVARVPVAHIHGGELTEGAIDNAFRHSITHMSQLHFTACEEYRRRVIQLGEHPDTVFNVGCLGLDGIQKIIKIIRAREKPNTIVVMFYPTTLSVQSENKEQFKNLIEVLDERKEKIVLIKSNADPQSREINRIIDNCVALNKCYMYFESLERRLFLQILEESNAIIGNSSAGIIEAPALGVPTINIGDRQKGRARASSVIDCDGTKEGIEKAFEKLYSTEFQESLRNIETPYKGGDVAKKIVKIIKEKAPEIKMKKKFRDFLYCEFRNFLYCDGKCND